jgi:hypothetical protein
MTVKDLESDQETDLILLERISKILDRLPDIEN